MIAVISDSHVPRRADSIPEEFLEKVEKADKTIHCGDFVGEEVYRRLEERSRDLIGVRGNCDLFDLPQSQTFERSGTGFGVYHGTGITPRGHLPTLVETARKLDVKVLLTGHTHQQDAKKQQGKIILNPGSCTGVSGGSYSGGNPEMMTVNIENRKLVARMLELDSGISSPEVEFEL